MGYSDSGNAIVGRRIVVSWKGPEASFSTAVASTAASAASHSSSGVLWRLLVVDGGGPRVPQPSARSESSPLLGSLCERATPPQPANETVHYHGGIAGVRWWFGGSAAVGRPIT